MLSSFCLSILIASAIATPHDVPTRRSPPALAPFYTLQAEHQDEVINNSYIVVLKDDLTASAMDNHLNFLHAIHEADPLIADGPVGLDHVYNSYLKGYSGRFTDTVVQRIRQMPEVSHVEQDSIVRAFETQKPAPWGLARITNRQKLTANNNDIYKYEPQGGDVDVYVIDTGININHVEFQGRASWGTTVPKNDVDEDRNGHGTHVAGTIASRKYGVAKSAHLIAVKVLGSDGSGSTADVIAGVLWVAEHAKKTLAAAKAQYAATGRTDYKGSVANMSLGGRKSVAMDRAVDRVVDAGVHFAVAAGNDNVDACGFSPAGATLPLTVGASNVGDEVSPFSNWGNCVEVFAPGQAILSAWIGSNTANNTISGTSMASPHVAGLMAYFLSIYPSKTFKGIDSRVVGIDVPSVPQRAFGALFSVARAALPSWMWSMLPAPVLESVAPTPILTLSPSQLRKSVIALATTGALTKVPPGTDTPNSLIFNNGTSL